jgi:signal peptidase I
MENLKKLWKNGNFQTLLSIVLIILIVAGIWFGTQAVLDTPYPVLAVTSGSMCIPYDAACTGWDHPFARTLHTGDLIIVQGVNPADLNGNYPNSDIIVYHNPRNPDELIVHRIVSEENRNGTLYFTTEGDGNGNLKWPNTPDDNDPWCPFSQDLVVGKVVMRIPWLGHVVLFMRSKYGVPVVIAIALLLIILEFAIPMMRRKPHTQPKASTPAPQNPEP